MEFTIKPPHLIILKYLLRRNNKEVLGNLKRTLIGQVKNIQASLDFLKNDEYIEISQAIVSLTQKSRDYINAYDNFGSEFIFKHQPDFAILKFLYEIDIPLALRWFPKIIQESARAYTKSNSDEGYNLQDYIIYHSSIKAYVLNANENFSLNSFGKKYYESIIEEQTKDSHKKNLETKNQMLQSQINELTLESLNFQKENRGLISELNIAQLEVAKLQKKELKRKILYSVIAFIAGGILTNIKDIFLFLKR